MGLGATATGSCSRPFVSRYRRGDVSVGPRAPPNIPRVRNPLDLRLGQFPYPLTICRALDRLTVSLFRSLLQQITSLHKLDIVAEIDASCFDRVTVSHRYAARTEYRFRSIKTTLLGNCSPGTILDVHCTTTKPHDTKIRWQVLRWNLGRIITITVNTATAGPISERYYGRIMSDR